MLEFWIEDAERMLAYIDAARLFGYEYFIERTPGSRTYHIVVYTDKFRAAAAKAAGLE